jgi:hypothetical protein
MKGELSHQLFEGGFIMNHWHDRRAISSLTVLTALVVLVLASAVSSRAQISPTGSGPGLSGRDRDINQREAEMTNLERSGKTGAKRDPQLVLAEVNEDFARLREIDQAIKSMLAATAPLDYKQVAENSAEVKKRAARLKTNLALPSAKDDKRQKIQSPGDDLKPSLTALELLINSFLTNPIFSDTGDVDARLAGKAKLDLDDILELSEKLRKSAEKMSKNAGKS